MVWGILPQDGEEQEQRSHRHIEVRGLTYSFLYPFNTPRSLAPMGAPAGYPPAYPHDDTLQADPDNSEDCLSVPSGKGAL